MATGAVVARILSQYSDKGSKQAQKDIAKLGKNIDAFGRKATKAFAAAGIASVAFAGKLAIDAVQGAMAEQKQLALLATALRNSAGATDSAIAANEAYLDSLELQVAIDNDQLIPALQTLVVGTGNLAKSQQLLSLATNVAAYSGKDLGLVSVILSKAYNGNTDALKKLNIPLSKAAIKSKDFAKIQKELTEETKGAAAAAANTFAGRLERLRLEFGQSADKIGYALLPALTNLVGKISKDVVPALQKFIRLNGDDMVRAFDASIVAIERAARAMVSITKFIKEFEFALKILGGAVLTVMGYLKLLAATTTVLGFLSFLTTSVKLAKAEMMLIGPVTQTAGANFAIMGVNIAKLGSGLRGFKNVPGIIGKITFAMAALNVALLPSAKIILAITIAVGALYAIYKAVEWVAKKFAATDRRRAADKQLQIKEEIAAGQRLAASYDSLEVAKQKAFEKNKSQQDVILSGFKRIEEQVKDANALNKKNTIDAARQARDAAEEAAAYQKKLRIQGMERAGAAKLALFNRKMLTDEKKMLVTLGAIKKNNAKLDKQGIKLTDPDEMTAIQMEAIYQNLLKGGKVILAETTKAQKALDDLKIKAAQEYNLLLTRQQDILKALSGDNKVTIEEVGLLAKQWGMGAEAAQFYVNQVLAIGNETIDTDEIERLALMWYGNTGKSAKESAEKYLNFLNEINKGNGTISAEGIKKLALKWFGSDGESATEAARKYEQAVLALKDNNLGRDEVALLMDLWGESADAVAAYLLETKIPFTVAEDAKVMFSPSIIALIAAGWNAAKTALENYLNAAKNASKIVIPVAPVIPIFPPGGTPGGKPFVPNPILPGYGSSKDDKDARDIIKPDYSGDDGIARRAAAAGLAAKIAAEKAAAEAAARAASSQGDALAKFKAKEAADLAKEIAAQAAQAAAQANALAGFRAKEALEAAEAQANVASAAADAIARQASALAAFKDKEARDLAAAQAAADAMDYDERFRHMAAQGVMSSAGDTGFKGLQASGNTTVNLTVNGSVSTENDLVQTIRTGLLRGQYNGQTLTLEAI